jgi:hypothetical protein
MTRDALPSEASASEIMARSRTVFDKALRFAACERRVAPQRPIEDFSSVRDVKIEES